MLSMLRESMKRVSAEAASIAKAGAEAALTKNKEVKKKRGVKKADKTGGNPNEGKGIKRKADPSDDQCVASQKKLKKAESISSKKKARNTEESNEDKEEAKKPKKKAKTEKSPKELALEAGPVPRSSFSPHRV